MKIYTKKGDKGETSLVDGSRVNKADIRIESYGTVDELNSHLGMLVGLLDSEAKFNEEVASLRDLQNWLFQLGSQLACSEPEVAKKLPNITEKEISSLETQMDEWESELPALKNFILPGGHLASSQAHICRTVSRRAERICVKLNEEQKLNYPAVAFLNRCSDYFFVFSRIVNHRLGIENIEWNP